MRRRLTTWALILVAAGVLFAMMQSSLRYDELTGPIPEYGRMHETVSARRFDIEVQRVQFAREVEYRYLSQDKVFTTSGLWAIVTAKLTATTESVNIWKGFWDGPRGFRYEQTDRAVNPPHFVPVRLDPGLPKIRRFLFEIRPDQVGDATLVVWDGMLTPRLDSEVHIALHDLPREADGGLTVMDRFSLNDPEGARP